MHRARLTNKSGAEHLEDTVHLNERVPEPLNRVSVIAGVHPVFRERHCTSDFDRHRPDFCGHSKLVEHEHNVGVELRHGAGSQVDRADVAKDRRRVEAMMNKIEVDLERGACRVGHQRGSQSARRDLERNIPPVVE